MLQGGAGQGGGGGGHLCDQGAGACQGDKEDACRKDLQRGDNTDHRTLIFTCIQEAVCAIMDKIRDRCVARWGECYNHTQVISLQSYSGYKATIILRL